MSWNPSSPTSTPPGSHPATPPVSTTEGYVPFRVGRAWYRIVGSGEDEGRLPLLVIHGGPGLPSDYLEPLASLAQGRRVIFYDQIGCGRSDHPHDPTLWQLDLFLEELGVVRRALQLERVHLLGHGWGGMLALEHVLTGVPGIAGLLLWSTPLSMPRYLLDVESLVATLPLHVREQVQRCGAEARWREPECEEAAQVFYRRHRLRLDTPPDCLARSLAGLQTDNDVFAALMGAHDFAVSGRLRNWDPTPRLGEINAPTLVLAGRHDVVPPAQSRALHHAIPWSEYFLFEQSAQMAHLEEPDLFLDVVGDFLARVEAYQ